MRLKMRKRESTVDCSCGCHGTINNETRKQGKSLANDKQSPKSVRACSTCACVVHCTTQMNEKERTSNITKQFWVWSLTACLPLRQAPHICLKWAYVFTPPVGYNGSLSTVNETCNKDKGHCTKKKCRCTSFKSLPHIKIGWTPVLPHLRTLLNVLFESFIAGHQICLGNGFLRAWSSVLGWHSLIDSTKENLSLSSEFLCMTVGCRGDSAFALGLKK